MNENLSWMKIVERQFGHIDSERRSRSLDVPGGRLNRLPIGGSMVFDGASGIHDAVVTPYASACSCPDHIHRLVACKHIIALAREMDHHKVRVDQRLLRVTVVEHGKVTDKSIPFDEAIAKMDLLGGKETKMVLGTPLVLASRPVRVEWEVA